VDKPGLSSCGARWVHCRSCRRCACSGLITGKTGSGRSGGHECAAACMTKCLPSWLPYSLHPVTACEVGTTHAAAFTPSCMMRLPPCAATAPRHCWQAIVELNLSRCVSRQAGRHPRTCALPGSSAPVADRLEHLEPRYAQAALPAGQPADAAHGNRRHGPDGLGQGRGACLTDE